MSGKTRQEWKYKGMSVFPSQKNTTGIRYECFTPWSMLLAKDKAEMEKLITADLEAHGVTGYRGLTIEDREREGLS